MAQQIVPPTPVINTSAYQYPRMVEAWQQFPLQQQQAMADILAYASLYNQIGNVQLSEDVSYEPKPKKQKTSHSDEQIAVTNARIVISPVPQTQQVAEQETPIENIEDTFYTDALFNNASAPSSPINSNIGIPVQHTYNEEEPHEDPSIAGLFQTVDAQSPTNYSPSTSSASWQFDFPTKQDDDATTQSAFWSAMVDNRNVNTFDDFSDFNQEENVNCASPHSYMQ